VITIGLWLASFAHLALVTAFVCTAIKEDDDRRLLLKMLEFLGVIAGGTAAFCVVILGVEWLF
jgi:hypothetical protein